jgi:hypothetical protein
MRILYGCCYKGHIKAPGCEIEYVDILPNLKKDNGNYIQADIKTIDFKQYDAIICTPPCNYYSRANYRRETSEYAQKTKELLPYCINKAINTGKPFIIENVINRKLMRNIIIGFPGFVYFIGRHTYFTNEFINMECEQWETVKNIQLLPQSKRQGGHNVESVLNIWIERIIQCYWDKDI